LPASSKISGVGELLLLDRIRERFKSKAENIIAGIGDDAAVIKPANRNLLVTTDMMVEKVHFDLRYMTPYQLGFKLISVNVSDVYAVGGLPAFVLLNIALNRNTEEEFVDILFDGIQDAMKLYKTVLIGGDLSASKKDLVLSATLIGYSEKQILRSGAKAGDRIYVTGNLGDSACGFELLKRIKCRVPLNKDRSVATGDSPRRSIGVLPSAKNSPFLKMGLSWEVGEPLIRRHLMPKARNPKKIVQHATAMIDISDGLQIDLTRICKESRVGARIFKEKIPISAEMREAASLLGLSPIGLALTGGEDYELLFTAPPENKVKAIYIGDIVKSKKSIVDGSGKEKPFSAVGYRHF
jgi:thiamine-monophosphate kinase